MINKESRMNKDWQTLTKMTGDRPLRIERVALENEGIAIEGRFELPPLAKLTADDQVFVAVFVKSHGSIKQMEKHFGISYPTVKARLNRVGAQLGFVEIEATADSGDVLSRLRQGEISADEAIKLIQKGE
jgi:hypothetical protein